MVVDNFDELIIRENDVQLIERFDEETDRKYLNKKCFKFKNKKPFRNKKPITLKPFKFYKDWNGVYIENTHYTGIIQLKNVRLCFYPKFNTHIFHMLGFLKTDEEFLYDPDKVIEIKEGINFFDIIGRLFFIQLNNIIGIGLLKKYTEKHENLGYIKGKLSIKGQIRNDVRHIPRFSCTYDDLTFDNIENRIILRALDIIIPFISIGELRKNLRRQEYIIRDFVELKTNTTPRDCDKIKFNRLNEYYRIIIKLAKMILEKNFVKSTKKGESKIFNFIVNTNTLYENFILEMIKDVVKKEFKGYEAKKKKIFKDLFKDNKINVQPDMVLKVKDSESYPIIFDAKYKHEDSNLDYYEMIAYCLAGNDVESGCLIYPKESGIDSSEHILTRLNETKIWPHIIDLYEEENLESDEFIKRIKNRIKEIISMHIDKNKEIAEKINVEDTQKQKKIVAENYLENVNEETKRLIKEYMIGKTLDKIYLTLNAIGGSVINIKTNHNSRFKEYTKVIVIDISYDDWKKKIGEIHNYSEITKVSDIPKLHLKNNRFWSKLGNCYITDNFIGTKVITDKNIAEHPVILVDYELNWKMEKLSLSETEVINPDNKEENIVPFTIIPKEEVVEDISESSKKSPKIDKERYRIAILEVLEKLGGKGKVKEILKIIEDSIIIPTTDYGTVPSGTDIIWVNNVRWERQDMVYEGLLRRDSPRGEWEITEKGKKFLEQNRKNIEKGNIIIPIVEEKNIIQPIEKKKIIRNWIGTPLENLRLRELETGKLGEQYKCEYSFDILPKLCKILMDRHKDFNIDKINKYLGTMYLFLGAGKGNNSKQIEGTDIYIETHFNNDDKVDLCYKIIKFFGYSRYDLVINSCDQ